MLHTMALLRTNKNSSAIGHSGCPRTVNRSKIKLSRVALYADSTEDFVPFVQRDRRKLKIYTMLDLAPSSTTLTLSSSYNGYIMSICQKRKKNEWQTLRSKFANVYQSQPSSFPIFALMSADLPCPRELPSSLDFQRMPVPDA
jgi:hypothetical protein